MQISFLFIWDFFIRSGDAQLQYTRKEVFIIIKEHLKDGLSTIIKYLEREILEKSAHSISKRDVMKASFSVIL